ncbi:hypothetical protein ELI41_03330 [Rhizobium leguminosarum]|uniref:Propionyl-coenzyme A carboxylase alpha polypeptide n=1 Tax=Rhizobium leguminosarum TaxID=384 RepID=A0ABD7PMJ8_RHILE|nr:hypothetical protein ELI41_03330 [Rhizobium leguminosarum]TAV52204.1 hypothetical protein ELI29_03330 [Rhizobium leguminosarum]TAV88321.1 hypothetical protein ELI22_03295 [Rhizobium leguminosarum]TAV92904.1 hypothetical protein ELI21_03300 [Rhizobium leguminosarum]TAW28584.1 hypothetical protein ELI19_03270 [Rhizobium leguminosarum]
MFTNLTLYSASSSALCRGSATYQPGADARDKPEHDERGVGRPRPQSKAGPCPHFSPQRAPAIRSKAEGWGMPRSS